MIKAHWSHFKYITKHKWYVFKAGLMLGVSLWQLIIHDWTKYTPSEWGAYVREFFNPDGTRKQYRRPDGGYDPNSRSQDFQYAWLNHQKNKHHWQSWISIGDGGELKPLPMPMKYIREMVADWCGAGRAITGRWDISEWYDVNKELMVLHPDTRFEVDLLVWEMGGKFRSRKEINV